MVGLSTYTANALLGWVTAGGAPVASGPRYMGLSITIPNDGGGFTEPSSGAGYSRVLVTSAWGTPSGVSPVQVSNNQLISFPQATADWTTPINPVWAVGLFDALTGGNMLSWDWVGSGAWQPFTISPGSPGLITCPGHGFSNSSRVIATSEYGGSVPLISGIPWIVPLPVSNAQPNTFTIGSPPGTISAFGNGMLRSVSPQQILSGVTATINGGNPGSALLLAA